MKTIGTLLVLATLVVVPISGCLVDEPSSAASVTGPAASSSGNSTTDPTDGNASAPSIDVVVSDNGTALEAENGTYNATAGVVLTFDASNSTAADGGNLTFSWQFDDGATSTNATENHTFEAGNHTVNLTVTDASGASANASLAFVVASGAPPSGVFVRTDTQTFEGSSDLAVQAPSCPGEGLDQDVLTWTIPASEPDGTMVIAVKLGVDFDPGTTHLDPSFMVTAPDGTVLADVDDNAPGSGESWSDEGQFAPGDYTITVKSCTSVLGDYTITATADLVTA